ncbi:YceI family protein [Glaciecola siphonariae]|uniref:YceI family protein n=1 Tax=Glaciecola siphonariae TaxID=521012 RepID=A0ABV9LZA0_9ALTE
MIQINRFTVLHTILAIALWCVASACYARFEINNQNASVAFSGEHAGMTFSGKFEQWTGSIILPNANDSGSIETTFDLSSAKTGDFVYDETLPEADWFDVENHPTGSFVSRSVTAAADGFSVSGELTLRGMSKPVKFTLKKDGGRLKATLPIKRLDYNIGYDSDPQAEWVSEDILLKIDVPAPPNSN